MIPLQGLFHFLNIMKLAETPVEVIEMFQVLSEIDGVNIPVEDTLNIKNGLNYAQFLEALLMIAHMKTKQAGGTQENPTEFTQIYKDTLEQIFSNLDLDISKRIKGDASGVLSHAFSQENTTVFYEHEVLL